MRRLAKSSLCGRGRYFDDRLAVRILTALTFTLICAAPARPIVLRHCGCRGFGPLLAALKVSAALPGAVTDV
jgi:hypothetical protein